ncbi:MAG TPA: hypothetical protein VFP57_00450 [Sphingomicrobium sp.]|jgi:hypothetical protein|nr:hypothetical protein [Sphingomicrobium sp.]
MTPAEQAQFDAMNACTDRASAEFTVLKDLNYVEDDSSANDFHVDANGAFVWTATTKGKGRPLSDNFSCRGNVKDRTVASVEFNGVVRRPSNQQVWKF